MICRGLYDFFEMLSSVINRKTCVWECNKPVTSLIRVCSMRLLFITKAMMQALNVIICERLSLCRKQYLICSLKSCHNFLLFFANI